MANFSRAKAQEVAGKLGCDAPSILAVAEVESGGRKDLPDGRPQILFEAQWFGNFTGGRYNESHPGISSSYWNRALYRGGAAEYDRLAEALALDETAALKSASWGLFQIMGFNHKAAGFATVQEYVAFIKGDDDADMVAFINFVKANPRMLQALRDHDDRTFAELYNGTGQIDYYAREIGAARDRHEIAGHGTPAPSMRSLHQGTFGDDVRKLQAALGVKPDSAFGPKTEQAVRLFQTDQGLVADGIVGPQTMAALGLLGSTP